MWVRQCDVDAGSDFLPPIPSRIASNEEFVPPPQSAEQKEYENRLAEISASAARRQGLSRRDFLRTGSGMAAALVALNQVFGDCYQVEAEEVDDPKAFEERWPKDQFILDVQTHHVDVSKKWYDETPTGRGVKKMISALKRLGVPAVRLDDYTGQHEERAWVGTFRSLASKSGGSSCTGEEIGSNLKLRLVSC